MNHQQTITTATGAQTQQTDKTLNTREKLDSPSTITKEGSVSSKTMKPEDIISTEGSANLRGAERFRAVVKIIIREQRAMRVRRSFGHTLTYNLQCFTKNLTKSSKTVRTRRLQIRQQSRLRARLPTKSLSSDSDTSSSESSSPSFQPRDSSPGRHQTSSHSSSGSSSSNGGNNTSQTDSSSNSSGSTPHSPYSRTSDEKPRSSSRWSPSSLKKALRSLSLNALLLPDPQPKKSRKILRAPVAYTYVRGLSGLPTQRVPLRRTPAGRSPAWPQVYFPHCYPPTAELCCLQRAAAMRALCLER